MAHNGLFNGFEEPLGDIRDYMEGSELRYELNDAKDSERRGFRKDASSATVQSTGDQLHAHAKQREDDLMHDHTKTTQSEKIKSTEEKISSSETTPLEKPELGDKSVDSNHQDNNVSPISAETLTESKTKNVVIGLDPARESLLNDTVKVAADDPKIASSDGVVLPQNIPSSSSIDNFSVSDIAGNQQLHKQRNKKHVQFRPASLVTGYLEPDNPWKDATSYDKGSVIRLYIETNLKFRTTPLTSVIHSITLRPGEFYTHQGDLIIDYSDTNLKLVSQLEVDALEPVLAKYQWRRIIVGQKLQFDPQQQEASKNSSEITSPTNAVSSALASDVAVSAAETNTPASGPFDDDEIDLRVENAKFCGVAFADDATAASFIDMIEYYKSCQQLKMCYVKNLGMSCMLSLSKMLRRPTTSLRALELRGSGYWIANSGGGLAGSNSMNAGDGDRNLKIFSISLRQASMTLRFLRLESCNLAGRSFFLLCAALRLNPHIRRVFLGDNQLQASDMVHMAQLLRNKLPTMCGIDVLDLRNNNIGDAGVEAIMNALIEQQVILSGRQSLRDKQLLENQHNSENFLLSAALAESVKPPADADRNDAAATDEITRKTAAATDVTVHISDVAADAAELEPAVAPELQKAKEEVTTDTIEEVIEEANPEAARLDGISTVLHHQKEEETDLLTGKSQATPPEPAPSTTTTAKPATPPVAETCLWRMESSEPWGNGVEPLCGLRSLSLFNNNITVNSLGPIANMLLQCASIESFNLGWNPQIGGSDAAHALKEALILSVNLRHLGMQNCGLDDEGVVALAEVVASRRQFLRLDLRCNPGVKLAGYLALAHAAKQHPSLLRIDIDERVVVMPKLKPPKVAGSNVSSTAGSEHSGASTPLTKLQQQQQQMGDTSSIASSTSDLTISSHLKSSGSSFLLRQSHASSPTVEEHNSASIEHAAASGGEDILMAQTLTNTLTEMFKHCNENLRKQLRLAQLLNAESSRQQKLSSSIDSLSDVEKVPPISGSTLPTTNADPGRTDSVVAESAPPVSANAPPAAAAPTMATELKNAREIKNSLLCSALFPYIALSLPHAFAASASGAGASATRSGSSNIPAMPRRPSIVNDIYTSGLAKFAAGMGFGSSSSSSSAGGNSKASQSTAKNAASGRNASTNEPTAKPQAKQPAAKSTSRFSITKVTSSLASILLPSDSVPHHPPPPVAATASSSPVSSLVIPESSHSASQSVRLS